MILPGMWDTAHHSGTVPGIPGQVIILEPTYINMLDTKNTQRYLLDSIKVAQSVYLFAFNVLFAVICFSQPVA